METAIFSTPVRIGISSFTRDKNHVLKRSRFTVVSEQTPTTSTNNLIIEAKSSYNVGATTPKTVYKDSWFDRLAINYLSKAVQDTVGLKNKESGYDGLLVATGAVFRSFDPIQQRQLVVKAIQSAIPGPIAFLIKTILPPSKFSREYFAAFTTIFFPWLVGPCDVKESEFEGSKERHIVHIKKCRFLESTNCAGMCTNLCKIPSQEFIKESFGIPINMVPNFDDMSCEMIFGQEPPALQDDPVFKQPCYKLCSVKLKHSVISRF